MRLWDMKNAGRPKNLFTTCYRAAVLCEWPLVGYALSDCIEKSKVFEVALNLEKGRGAVSEMEKKEIQILFIEGRFYSGNNKLFVKKFRQRFPNLIMVLLAWKPMAKDRGVFNLVFSLKNDIQQLEEAVLKLVKHIRAVPHSKNASHSDLYSLTQREIQIAGWVVTGVNSDRIARELNISTNTVITHRRNINQKLGVRNVAELIAILKPLA
jgi:DNA-binding CsgD family transcriptional regulator